jgi:cell division protein FtsI (penicillin-binding protein 3)
MTVEVPEFENPALRGRLRGQNRIRLLGLLFCAFFLAIAVQLGRLTLLQHVLPPNPELVMREPPTPRPDIVDRNGIVMATDMAVASLYIDPRKIIDIDETVETLTAAMPDIDAKTLRQRLLQPGKAFIWLKRQVSPEERDLVYNLGLPGVGYVNERKRVYPLGRLAAQAIGYVDIDNKGIAGMEKFLDDRGAMYTASLAGPDSNSTAPAQISIDTRVQQVVTDEVSKAVLKFRAKFGGGIILNTETGEIVSMASVPDYNPNEEVKNLTSDQQNKLTGGVYELGSVIKAVTFAMAFDAGVITMESTFDVTRPLIIGNARINEFHAPRRVLTVPEVFTYSSNIGSAKMALEVGLEGHREFLKRVGLFDRMVTELPESAKPLLPRQWTKLSSATAAFGAGFAVQPLQGLSVISNLINGGLSIPPTMLKRDKASAEILSRRIIKPETSEKMRYLLRLNVLQGTATRADVVGYRVGGKTGTAEKVINGRYSKDKNLTSFIGAFPMDNPKYAIYVMLDEPVALPETYGFTTAGWNAVPTAAKIIERIAPILGIVPEFTADDLAKLAKQAKAAKKDG